MLSSWALCAFGAQTVAAVAPLVDVSYSRYMGTQLSNGISQWLGIRFAAPPLGNLRFAAPQDPPYNASVQMANAVSTFTIEIKHPLSRVIARFSLSGYCRWPTHGCHERGLPVFGCLRPFLCDARL